MGFITTHKIDACAVKPLLSGTFKRLDWELREAFL